MSQYTGVRLHKEIFHAINYRHVEYVMDVTQGCHTLASVCLCALRLNVSVNNFSVMSGQSQVFLGLTSTVRI